MDMHSLFAVDTGELTGFRMGGTEEDRAINTPDGHAWVAGDFAPRRYRVQMVTDDHGTQQPVATQRTPPRPADNPYQAWAWDDAAGDWVAVPTRLWREAAPRAERDRLLSESDWVVMRAVETGATVPAQWLAYRAALRDITTQSGFPDSIVWPEPPTT